MKHAQVPAVWRGSRRWWLLLLVGVGIGQALLAVAGGIAVGRAFRALSRAPSASSEIWLLAVIVLASALGLAVLRAAERFLAEKVGQSYVHELRMRLLDHVLAGPMRDSTRRSVGGTALRFSSDLSAVRQWVSLGLARLVVAVPLLVVALAFLAWVSVLIAVASGIGVAVGMVAYGLLARRVRGSSRQARRLRGKMAAEVTELVARLGVVVTHGAERREHNRIGRGSRMLRDAQVQRGFDIGSLRAASEIAAGVATSGCIVAAGLAGVAAHDVAAALIVLGALVVPLRDLGTVHEYRAGYAVAADRIAQVFARPVRSTDQRTACLPDHGGRVELDRVGVDEVLDDVTLLLPAGSCAVVVGANGAGKSTLLGLISGLVQPDRGRVTIDGVDVGRSPRWAPRHAWRRWTRPAADARQCPSQPEVPGA